MAQSSEPFQEFATFGTSTISSFKINLEIKINSFLCQPYLSMQLRLRGTGSGNDENEFIDDEADNGGFGGKCIIFYNFNSFFGLMT